VIKELQESLKKNREYEGTIKTLQENLSVCYTKEKELEEQLSKFKGKLQTIQETANRANALNVRIKTLSEQLQKQQEQNQILKDRNSKLQEGLLRTRNSGKEMNNTLTEQYDKVNRLTEQINSLNNLVEKTRLDCDKREQSLMEQIEDMKKDSSIKTSEYRTKLSSANKLVEKYQRIARLAVDKYIGSMATKLGVNPSEIKNRLKENYSFEDIDKVCEDLKKL
jgi:chromosome segregation ATPase